MKTSIFQEKKCSTVHLLNWKLVWHRVSLNAEKIPLRPGNFTTILQSVTDHGTADPERRRFNPRRLSCFVCSVILAQLMSLSIQYPYSNQVNQKETHE